MSGRARLGAEARADLRGLTSYIRLENPAAAERVRLAILQAVRRLGDQPGLGHLRPDLTDRSVKFLTVRGRFMLCYLEDESGIIIVRIFGPGRDVAALL